jgi:hypothetical protein
MTYSARSEAAMTADQVAFEAIKLGAQFIGALVVARLAVNWALRRYKSEKTWERRLAAYVDGVTALSEMRLVVGRWMDEIENHREPPEEVTARQRDRYQTAHRRLEEGVAAALLLLPGETADLLSGLDRRIERASRGENQHDDLDAEYGVLSETLNSLIRLGRSNIGHEIGA